MILIGGESMVKLKAIKKMTLLHSTRGANTQIQIMLSSSFLIYHYHLLHSCFNNQPSTYQRLGHLLTHFRLNKLIGSSTTNFLFCNYRTYEQGLLTCKHSEKHKSKKSVTFCHPALLYDFEK